LNINDHIVDFVDRIILLSDHGEILADGSKQDVFHHYKHILVEQGIWYPDVWDDYLQATRKHPPNIRIGDEKAAISVENFSGYRGKDKKIDVKNVEVFPGEWVTVIGKNGAGKSTLLHALMDLIKTKGTYKIFGQELENQKNKRLCCLVFKILNSNS
jgi:energy-coupling factor transport system ATP-binding protein